MARNGYEYFDDLSGNGSSSEDDHDDDYSTTNDEPLDEQDPQAYRIVIHADVDCFYCQCELIDKGLDPTRPFAIGQKHIIVTSNYAARKVGVGKLMSRDEAYRKCPSLLIIEGSDLERYRTHGRKIYEAFREACTRVQPESKVAKGSMDEMMAEFDPVFSSETAFNLQDAFFYRQGDSNQIVVMKEDQTGVETVVESGRRRFGRPNLTTATRASKQYGALQKAATDALLIRNAVLQQTRFTMTIGVSCNPLLAKLASGLKKPHTVNVLDPVLAPDLVASMPLRKLPGIGRQSMKALSTCLEGNFGARSKKSPPWTCWDLLQVPRNAICESLGKQLKLAAATSELQCDHFINLCRGFDDSPVLDDGGGLQKTLSVENSFRRGSVRSKEAVLAALESLYRRLPRLFKKRIEWSNLPERAYPKTIRVTARSMTQDSARSGSRRRPFVTHSQQAAFDGVSLLRVDAEKQASILREAVKPLVQSLVYSKRDVNLTRLNIALCNFQDIPTSSAKMGKCSSSVSGDDLSLSSPVPRNVPKRRKINDFFGRSPPRSSTNEKEQEKHS